MKFAIFVNQIHGNANISKYFDLFSLELSSYNGGTCVATVNAYICQCTYPYSGSNCEMALATQAAQPTCACILCPCPTPAPASNNPCLY